MINMIIWGSAIPPSTPQSIPNRTPAPVRGTCTPPPPHPQPRSPARTYRDLEQNEAPESVCATLFHENPEIFRSITKCTGAFQPFPGASNHPQEHPNHSQEQPWKRRMASAGCAKLQFITLKTAQSQFIRWRLRRDASSNLVVD